MCKLLPQTSFADVIYYYFLYARVVKSLLVDYDFRIKNLTKVSGTSLRVRRSRAPALLQIQTLEILKLEEEEEEEGCF